MDGAVAVGGAEFEVFGQEQGDGDAVASVDADLLGEVFVGVAVEEAEMDAGGIGFGDALEKGALLDAVAAPDAGDDQDVDFAGEAGDELGLGGGEFARRRKPVSSGVAARRCRSGRSRRRGGRRRTCRKGNLSSWDSLQKWIVGGGKGERRQGE